MMTRKGWIGLAAAGLAVAAALFTVRAGAQGTAAPPSTTAAPPPGGALPDEIAVSISRGGLTKIAIATPAFPVPDAGTADPAVDVINRTFQADLSDSGVFSLVDPTLHPGLPGASLAIDQAAAWRNTGAEVLVTGKIERSGTSLVLDARVYDLKSAKMIMGRRYRGTDSWARRVAHTLANDLLYYFTGRNGTFLTKIAFVSDRDGSKEIWVMDSDGDGQARLTKTGLLALGPDWSPDATSLVYQHYSGGGPRLMKIPAGGGAPIPLPTGLDLNAMPAHSPDGSKIAFVGARKGNSGIFVMDSTGANVRQLTPTRGVESAPCWSPTGREIAFVSNRSGSPQIYVMDAEGANVRRLTFEGSYNDAPAWSPDGGKIAFTTRIGNGFHIAVIDLATGMQSILTDQGRNESPTWSPDGLRIAFSSTRRGKEQVFVMEADGTNARALTTEGNNFSPAWSKVGL